MDVEPTKSIYSIDISQQHILKNEKFLIKIYLQLNIFFLLQELLMEV